MLRYLSLFSGVGAFEKALENIGKPFEIVNFCEIDNKASRNYSILHKVSETLNLGDITKIDFNNLPINIDLLTHGSPCTNFSTGGKNTGGDEGSGTASSLMWYSVEIIKRVKPKIVIWENVANVLSKRHKHNFDKYLSVLSDLGYEHNYNVYNSKYFGVPQNRSRLLCVSILKTSNYYFEEIGYDFVVSKYLKDILEMSYPESMIVKRPMKPEVSSNLNDVKCIGQTSTKKSQAGKVYSINGIFPTLCAGGGNSHGYSSGYIQDDKGVVRKVTPLEAFRLMGFSDSDYEKLKDITSDTQLYRQMGNSIVVPILEYVFKCIKEDSE